jgi:hypothetical protein
MADTCQVSRQQPGGRIALNGPEPYAKHRQFADYRAIC